jgi:hypothetical protein
MAPEDFFYAISFSRFLTGSEIMRRLWTSQTVTAPNDIAMLRNRASLPFMGDPAIRWNITTALKPQNPSLYEGGETAWRVGEE